MSSFTCEICHTDILDTPEGYITECEHWRKANYSDVSESQQVHDMMFNLIADKMKKEARPIALVESTTLSNCCKAPITTRCTHMNCKTCQKFCAVCSGRIEEEKPVSCDCQCYCNESKYDVGTMLSTQCEHCKYLLNKPVSSGKECDTVTDKFTNLVNEIANNSSKILDDFCKAYMAETGLMPSECHLIQQIGNDGRTTWRFERYGKECDTISKKL